MVSKKTILFVESDPVALAKFGGTLQREGFLVESASNGLDALKRISQAAPDLLILDVMLPRFTGEEVLKFVRADPRLKHLPVIIFSDDPTAQPAPGTEPTTHLLKNECTLADLREAIRHLLPLSSLSGAQPGLASGSAPPPVQNSGPGEMPAGSAPCEPHSEFLGKALAEMPRIREHCFAYLKAPASAASLQHLPSLYQRIRGLSSCAEKDGCARVAMLTRPFDALLSEIMVKPAWVTPSVLQTIAQAVDCLNLLLNSNSSDLSQPVPQAKVLAVDDDAVCNHVMVSTLKRANFDAKSIDDPFAALELIEKTQYDLILLDINMPGLTGFELCEKLRHFPHCKNVPVIFITGHNNFDNRKQCVLSGGHDFITKPISSSELALKATLHLLKSRTKSAGSSVPTAAPASVELSPDSHQNESSPAPTPATTGTGADSASADEPVQANGCAGNETVPGEDQVIEFARNEDTASTPAAEVTPAHYPEEVSQELVVTGISAQESTGEDVAVFAGARPSTTETGTAIPDGPILENSLDTGSSGRVDVPVSCATSHPEPGDMEAKMDEISRIVAMVMFGENGATVANLRLVRIALDHYQLGDVLKRGELPVVCSHSDSE